jgi:hypothetical protein
MRHTIRVVAVGLVLGLMPLGLVDAADAPAKKAATAKKDVPAGGSAATAAIKEVLQGEDVRDFRSFCDEWMGKLRTRDRDNVASIKWENRDGQVVGEHVGYGTERTCVAREAPGKDPIGKITYREIRYRREGKDPATALAATGTIVEQTDVTEIFRFAKGRWQY